MLISNSKWAKDSNRHFTEDDTPMTNKLVQRRSAHSLGKCKSRLNESPPTRTAIKNKGNNSRPGRGETVRRSAARNVHSAAAVGSSWQVLERPRGESLGAQQFHCQVSAQQTKPTCTQACTQMFSAGLFEIAPNWKRPKCLSTGEETDGCGPSAKEHPSAIGCDPRTAGSATAQSHIKKTGPEGLMAPSGTDGIGPGGPMSSLPPFGLESHPGDDEEGPCGLGLGQILEQRPTGQKMEELCP